MLDKLDAEFAFGRQALDVRAYRQELLSSNIANSDTPGYARDVDFASTLARSLKQAGGGLAPSNAAQLPMAQPAGVTNGMSMVSTAAGHMAGTAKLIPTGGRRTTTAVRSTGCRCSRRSTATRSISTSSACSSRTTRCTTRPG